MVQTTDPTPLLASEPPDFHDEGTPVGPEIIAGGSQLRDPSERQTFKIAATMLSFVVLGLFTSSTGVLLPSLTSYYHLTDLQVSTIFLIIPAGYIVSASTNSFLHARFGQRGVAVLGPFLHIVSAVLVAARPGSFGGILLAWGIMAMGTGLLDGSWCAMAGAMGSTANRVSGLLHGSFSTGAAIGPFVFAGLTAREVDWWIWYWILAGASFVELVVLILAFRHSDATAYHGTGSVKSPSAISSSKPPSTSAMFSHTALWISALYFLTYVGNETAVSGWIVSFMTRARGAPPYLSSISSSGYWAGMAVGRLTLGHITDKIGARKGAVLYLTCAIGLQLFFALTRSPIVSIVIASLLGFSMGPLFPSGVVVLTELLPKEMHVKAVSFVSSLGQVGGAALPFGIGAVVQTLGIGVFCWVLLVFSSVSLAVWCVFAGLKPKHDGWGEGNDGIDYIAVAREE